jgi:hypothetical protein
MRHSLLTYGIVGPLVLSMFTSLSTAHAAELVVGDELPTLTTVETQQEELHRVQDVLDRHVVQPWLLQLDEASSTAATDIRGRRLARYAAQLYIVERRLVSHVETLAEHAILDDSTFDAIHGKLVALLGRLQWNYPSVLEGMRREMERNNPGRSGGTEVHRADRYVGTPGGGIMIPTDIYEPTYLTDKTLTPTQKAEAYEKIKAAFLAKHGPEYPLHEPLGKVVEDRFSGHIFEWVVMPNEEVRATADGKHALMAEGGGVLAAGGSRVWKRSRQNGDEHRYMALISNWTGTYQSEMAATTQFVQHLYKAAGVAETNVIFTPSMPMSTRTFENILVANGLPKDKARRAGAQLVRHANRLASADRARVNDELKVRGIRLH